MRLWYFSSSVNCSKVDDLKSLPYLGMLAIFAPWAIFDLWYSYNLNEPCHEIMVLFVLRKLF